VRRAHRFRRRPIDGPCRPCSDGSGAKTFCADPVMARRCLQEGRTTLHRILKSSHCSQRNLTPRDPQNLPKLPDPRRTSAKVFTFQWLVSLPHG
jgi:hypothetical protein